jgi:hypothetical protein
MHSTTLNAPFREDKKRAEPPVNYTIRNFRYLTAYPMPPGKWLPGDYGRETNIFQKTRLQM